MKKYQQQYSIKTKANIKIGKACFSSTTTETYNSLIQS